jgi:hypothetical protein
VNPPASFRSRFTVITITRAIGAVSASAQPFQNRSTRSGSLERIASAVGEGAMAVQLVHEYLKEM